MKKSKQDMAVMLVFMILSAVVYLVFIPTQIRLSSDTGFTNRTFPKFTMAVIFAASAAGFLEAFVRYRMARRSDAPEKAPEEGPGLRSRLLPLLGFLVVLAYGLVFHFGGLHWRGYSFLLATALFIPAFLLLLRCRDWRYYAAAYSFAAVMYLIFRFILKVALR